MRLHQKPPIDPISMFSAALVMLAALLAAVIATFIRA